MGGAGEKWKILAESSPFYFRWHSEGSCLAAKTFVNAQITFLCRSKGKVHLFCLHSSGRVCNENVENMQSDLLSNVEKLDEFAIHNRKWDGHYTFLSRHLSSQ